MSTRILGIDPGLQNAGWGIVDVKGNQLSFIASGVIRPAVDLSLPQRILTLHQGLNDVITQFKPHEAAVEETFVNKNALSSLKLGHARGALILTAASHGLEVAEYGANKIKKTVTGQGKAEKAQIEMMVRILLPGARFEKHDAADALAVAITHAHYRQSLVASY